MKRGSTPRAVTPSLQSPVGLGRAPRRAARTVVRALAAAAVLLLAPPLPAGPPEAPVTKLDITIDDVDLRRTLLTLSTRIGALYEDQLQADDPACRGAAILVAQQAADNYGYWQQLIDLLKQTAKGLEDGAKVGGNKTAAKVGRLAGALVDAFDSDDPYGALGQLLIGETTDWVSGKAKSGNETVDDQAKKLAEEAKNKLINAFFPGKPRKATTYDGTVGKCTVHVTPEFAWSNATTRGGLRVVISGDCECAKPLELKWLKATQNPHLQEVKNAELGPFRIEVFLPLTGLETSISFNGTPIDAKKFLDTIGKLRKAMKEGSSDVGDLIKDVQDQAGKASSFKVELKLRPVFGKLELKDFYAKCGCAKDSRTVTGGGTGGTSEQPTPGTTKADVEYINVTKLCDPTGERREEIARCERDLAYCVKIGCDQSLLDKRFNRLKEARDAFCPCLEKHANDPSTKNNAELQEAIRNLQFAYCRETARPMAPTPTPTATPTPSGPPTSKRDSPCYEAKAVYDGAAAQLKQFPYADHYKKAAATALKKLCDCLAEHPDQYDEELLKLCPPPPTTPKRSVVPKRVNVSVWIVLPRETRQGQQVTGRIVMDPQAYRSTPGLGVYEIPASLHTGDDGKPTLDGATVDTGDGRRQPVDQPVTVKVPPEGQCVIDLYSGDDPLARKQIDTGRPSTATPQPPPGKPRTPPTSAPGAVDIVEGAFGGDGPVEVRIGDRPATVLARTGRAVFFQVPPDTPTGVNEVTITCGGKTTKLRVAVLGLAMSADKTELLRGESTKFEVKVLGLAGVPDTAWRAGHAPDLVDVSKLPVKPPAPGEPGRIVLVIRNMSPAVVSISGAKDEAITLVIDRSQVTAGQYAYRGTIHSKKSGSFNISGTLIPFLAPVEGELTPP